MISGLYITLSFNTQCAQNGENTLVYAVNIVRSANDNRHSWLVT